MKNRIKETRVAKGMTQGELANKSGLTRPYISKLENNEERIFEKELVANAFGYFGNGVRRNGRRRNGGSGRPS